MLLKKSFGAIAIFIAMVGVPTVLLAYQKPAWVFYAMPVLVSITVPTLLVFFKQAE